MTEGAYIAARLRGGRLEPVVLFDEDRGRHAWVLGQTGTGKSSLLWNCIVSDIESGRGVGVIDFHGDLSMSLLDYIPPHRVKDVFLLDLSDRNYPVSVNILAGVPRADWGRAVDGLVTTLRGIWSESWGPRMENILRHSLKALLECENVSLLGLKMMLSNDDYRRWVLKQGSDPMVAAFWRNEFDCHSKATRAEYVGPVLNKVNALLLSPEMRCVLGQVRNRFDFRALMDDGGILIANLSKGLVGADNASFLGAVLIGQFEAAAMSRMDAPEAGRRPFTLFLDEWQSIVTERFASILSEIRKTGASVVLANQFCAQIREPVLKAVRGNVGTILAFRVGAEDAEALSAEFGGDLSPGQFTSLANREIAVRMLRRGRVEPPFTALTYDRYGERHGRREQIVRRSRQRHARRRHYVEWQQRHWLKGMSADL